MAMNYIEFINERKQVGILYHFTMIHALGKILETNSLKSHYPYISFTRNKSFETSSQVRIVIDGDKLSDKYRIEPFAYGQSKNVDKFGIPVLKKEAEERIIVSLDKPDWSHSDFISELKDIKKYIIRIDVLHSKSERYQPFLNSMMIDNPDINFRMISLTDWNRTLVNADVDRIKKFESFTESDLFTNEFRIIISKIDSPISNIILNFNKPIDISNVNPMTGMENMVSYVRNGKKEMMKIGSFVTRILSETGDTFQPNVIEKFVNEYKGTFSFISSDQNFETVYGENIRKYYLDRNYSEGGGTLQNSCMKFEYCQKYLNIFVENPDRVNLLILRNPKNRLQIDGRALLWTLDNHSGKKFLDFPYTSKDYMYKIFEEYAKKKGWYYTKKEEGEPSHYRFLNVFDPSGNKTDEIFYVNLTPEDYEFYPYLDIMRFFNPDTGYLTNDKNSINEEEGIIVLGDEKGRYITGSNYR
jgi:hypothetical protein